jgi:hypothetical protein
MFILLISFSVIEPPVDVGDPGYYNPEELYELEEEEL